MFVCNVHVLSCGIFPDISILSVSNNVTCKKVMKSLINSHSRSLVPVVNVKDDDKMYYVSRLFQSHVEKYQDNFRFCVCAV